MKRAVLLMAAAATLLVPATAPGAAFKSCEPVRNVAALDGSRWGMFLGAAVQTYNWRRWWVHRDLAGSVDGYRAAVPETEKRVRWLFGSL
jgi:hypothetical protein